MTNTTGKSGYDSEQRRIRSKRCAIFKKCEFSENHLWQEKHMAISLVGEVKYGRRMNVIYWTGYNEENNPLFLPDNECSVSTNVIFDR